MEGLRSYCESSAIGRADLTQLPAQRQVLKAQSNSFYMNSWHVADQVWRELEFAFVFAFVVSCELIRLGWQESGCPLSQPGLLCFKEVGCL